MLDMEQAVGYAMAELERRRQNRGLTDISYMTAAAIITMVGNSPDREQYEEAFGAAKEAAARMIPLRYPEIPHDFLRRHRDNPSRFVTETTEYSLGLEVADEILRPYIGR